MKKKTWLWSFLFIFIIGIGLVSWQKLEHTRASAEVLSKKEAQNLIEDRYQGMVTQIKFVNQQYQIMMEKENNVYKIRLDAITGKVLSFIQSGGNSTPSNNPSGSSDPIINDSQKKLTEIEAQRIAEKQVNGTADDIWIEVQGDVTYYMVKVDTKEGKEAIVQVHSITGNIISVTWDDHHEKVNRDKDDDG